MKRQTKVGKKIFAIHVSDKGLESFVYPFNPLNIKIILNYNKVNKPIKSKQKTWCFTKEDMQKIVMPCSVLARSALSFTRVHLHSLTHTYSFPWPLKVSCPSRLYLNILLLKSYFTLKVLLFLCVTYYFVWGFIMKLISFYYDDLSRVCFLHLNVKTVFFILFFSPPSTMPGIE